MKETLNITKFTDYNISENLDGINIILDKINKELTPNKIYFDGQSISYNNKITIFQGGSNEARAYINGLYQGIILLKAKI